MSFSVNHEQLRGHAGTLAGYADQLAATGTQLPDALGQESLGQFGGFMTAGLGGAMKGTLEAFAEIASAMDKVSAGMRQVADEYQRTDDDSAASLAGVSR